MKTVSCFPFRKELELRGHDDSDSDEDNAGADEGAVGCLGFSRARSKVVPADNAQEAYGKAGAGAEDENGNNVDPNGLVALKTKIETHMAQFEDTIKDITDEGDLFEKLDKQNRIMWLRFLSLCLFAPPPTPSFPLCFPRLVVILHGTSSHDFFDLFALFGEIISSVRAWLVKPVL